MAAKDLICSGVRRRIGNGSSTLIWEHPWLQDDLDPMIQTEMPPQLTGAKVAGLINQETGTWDLHILSDIFQPSDVPRILKIPISPDYEDVWYWHGNPNGCYSVKNGYRLIVGNYGNNDDGAFDKWLTLWKLKIPPKWKTFLWRAISDVLPTTNNLLIKRVDVDPICAMCGITHEDTMHSLVLCGYANSIWTKSNLPLPNVVTNIFHVWFSAFLNVLDTNGTMYAAAILYHIWRARNGAVWDAYLPMPKKLIATAAAAMQAWRRVHHTAADHTARAADETATALTADGAAAAHSADGVAAAHAAEPMLPPPPLPTVAPRTAAAGPRKCYVNAGYHHTTNSATIGAVYSMPKVAMFQLLALLSQVVSPRLWPKHSRAKRPCHG